jgi:chromosomal replication initiator protein
VAREWGVTVDGLRSKTRTKNLTVPRQIAMYLTRELLSTQLVEIGNAFGGRDHSTVIHSLEKVQQSLIEDSDLKKRISKVRSLLQNSSSLSPPIVERATHFQNRFSP